MREKPTIWDTLSLGLWAVFFSLGLAPELAFHLLRDLAKISYFTAIVNSSSFITLALVTYLSLFVYRRCLETSLSPAAATAKAIQCGLIALVAFLDLPSGRSTFEVHTILELLFQLPDMPGLYVQAVVILVVATKLAAWWYLYALVFRYHAFGNRGVFANIPAVFPSARPDTSGSTPVAPGTGNPDTAGQPVPADDTSPPR